RLPCLSPDNASVRHSQVGDNRLMISIADGTGIHDTNSALRLFFGQCGRLRRTEPARFLVAYPVYRMTIREDEDHDKVSVVSYYRPSLPRCTEAKGSYTTQGYNPACRICQCAGKNFNGDARVCSQQ